MGRTRAGLLCAGMLMAAVPAAGQDPQGWQASVDVLNILTRGNDVHVGDVFTESQQDGGTLINSTFDYGVTSEPIRTRMPDRLSVLLAGGYRGARWGAGARGWRVLTSDALDGRAQSPTPTSTFSAATGVRMWDHSTIPVVNDSHPSGFAPVRWDAENELEHLRVDVFGERLWLNERDLHVAMRFGLAYARVDNTRAEGHDETAVAVTTGGGAVTTFTNTITLDSDSEASMRLFGPSLGITGAASHGRFVLEWLVNPAVLLGDAETSGTWIDIDNITQTTTSSGGPITTTDRLRGVLETELEERVVVPVLDLQVKASVRLVRGLRVGAGLFTSSWFGLPVAPAFSLPGDWTDVEGTGWRSQNRDITYVAYSGFVAVGF